MFLIDYRLNFTAVTIACSFEDIKGLVQYQMPLLVHIPYRPITKLAIVDNTGVTLLPITEGKGTAGEFRRLNTFHFTLTHGPHRQRVTNNGFEKSGSINCTEKTFCEIFRNNTGGQKVLQNFRIFRTYEHFLDPIKRF